MEFCQHLEMLLLLRMRGIWSPHWITIELKHTLFNKQVWKFKTPPSISIPLYGIQSIWNSGDGTLPAFLEELWHVPPPFMMTPQTIPSTNCWSSILKWPWSQKYPTRWRSTPQKSSPLFLSTATNFYFQSIWNSGVGTLPAFRDAIVVEDEGHLKSSLNYYWIKANFIQ